MGVGRSEVCRKGCPYMRQLANYIVLYTACPSENYYERYGLAVVAFLRLQMSTIYLLIQAC